MVHQRVHQPDVDGELESLALSSHGVGLGYGHCPFLGLGQAPYGLAAGEAAGFDQQVGRPTESITANQRQLQHHIGGVAAQASISAARTVVDQLHVHPVGDPLDLGEELAQCTRAVGHRVSSVFERGPELAHGDTVVVVGVGDPHGADESCADLVALHEPLTDQLDQLVIGAHRFGEQL